MFDAVHADPSPYTKAQRNAWVAAPRAGEEWSSRLTDQYVVLATNADEYLGFMSLVEATGYIDFAYISANARGQGLFRILFENMENRALTLGLERLWLHASLMAAPAFSAMGFHTVKEETVEIGNQSLRRTLLEKRLGG